MPSKVYGNSITLESDSFVRKIDDQKIPTLSEIRTKIKEIKPADTLYCVEAIILKSPEKERSRQRLAKWSYFQRHLLKMIQVRFGSRVGDHRQDLLEQFTQGEIITVTAVNAKSGLEGRTELFLSPYSVITRKN